MNIIAEVDDGQVQINFQQLQLALLAKVPKSLMDVGFEILRLSNVEVPLDEGTLQNSGTVELHGATVQVGYHTPYARRLHQHPEYHFQRGRKGKYLEDPIRRNQGVLGIKFKDSFGGGVKASLK